MYAYADLEGLGLCRSLLLTLCVHITDSPVEFGWLANVELCTQDILIYPFDIVYKFSKVFIVK